MKIPSLSKMDPADRAELMAFLSDVEKRLASLDNGRLQNMTGQQVLASDATVSTGLVTKRQMDAATAPDAELAATIKKIKSDVYLLERRSFILL